MNIKDLNLFQNLEKWNTEIAKAFNLFKGKIGNLNNLQTASKASLVDAINELKSSSGGDSAGLDISKDIETLKKYVQSRGQGLVTNGSGLMGDNTNFSRFKFSSADSYSGFGMFTTNERNFDASIDELIPVKRDGKYRITFFAKTLNKAENTKAYFYVSCLDIDGKIIYPHNEAKISFRITSPVSKGTDSMTVHDEDVEKLRDWLATARGGFIFANGRYTSSGGFKYPDGVYSQDTLNASAITYTKVSLDGNVLKFPPLTQFTGELSGESLINIGQIGGTYIYPLIRGAGSRDLADHEIPEEWAKYTIDFSAGTALRKYTQMIKIGWLLNRGNTAGNETAISDIDVKEID